MRTGRGRRRGGLNNRVRRGLYAVLLWLSCPPLLVAAEVDDQAQTSGPSQEGSQAKLSIERLRSSVAAAQQEYRVTLSVTDPRVAAPFRHAAEILRTRSWRFNDSLPNLRGGLGLDIELPDAGNLHLRLFPDERHPDRGLRWEVTSSAAALQRKLWSFGGAVDVIRTEPEQRVLPSARGREIALTPQLVLDMDRLADLPGSAQLTMQYGHWRDGVTDRHSGDRVLQLNVVWRF